MIYVAKVSEDEVAHAADNKFVKQVHEFVSAEGAKGITICAETVSFDDLVE